MKILFFLLLFLFINFSIELLHVQKNERRSYDSLNGLWTFVKEPFNVAESYGIKNEWYRADLSSFNNATVVPVPSSYNDLFANKTVRDHVGWVWYQTKFYINAHDRHNLMKLRFGSVQYYSKIWLNNDYIGEHVGGHLPFEFDIEPTFHHENILTVAVNNTLSYDTIPQASFEYVHTYEYKGVSIGLEFDFFNYAGILRPVYILKLPTIYIQNLYLTADHHGNMEYTVKLNQRLMPEYGIEINIYRNGDSIKNSIYSGSGINGKIKLNENKIDLWWPRNMGKPNLYVFQVTVMNIPKRKSVDIYRETFGFRSVETNKDNQLLINGKPFYCAGFGMHEDFDLIGRGFSQVVMTKDLNMFEWLNGNCFRTSHYPYSEERMYEADRRGIVVIDETQAVALKTFNDNLLKQHKNLVNELYERDHRHPSVIIWSLANEPNTAKEESREYFKTLIDEMKSLDKTRPVTVVLNAPVNLDVVGDLLDLICINRYFGWYVNHGHIDSVYPGVVGDILAWNEKYNKPLILTEYGAESILGFSDEPSKAYTVEYQVELLAETHRALDFLKSKKKVVGEMIWNFADFMMTQTLTRMIGNHKGVLTRNRQPKMSAYLVKERYTKILFNNNNKNCSHIEL